jgi:GT2 family glycosyltransferase
MVKSMSARVYSENELLELKGLENIDGIVSTDSCVDVIIPVYNAYEDLIICLNSVFLYRAGYRVILINDKSTDPRIYTLFRELASWKYDWLLVIENEINLGFVKSVNKGMKLSGKDVILLNSDTIVTKGWAGKIHHCAYSGEEIATVTPFTNNGTICSIPEFCETNGVPDGFTVDSFAGLVESVSLNTCPEIPTAVGFCMFIKRSVITISDTSMRNHSEWVMAKKTIFVCEP